MTRYFTADPHFGHEDIFEFMKRPFSSVDEMDAHLLDQINSTVGRNDTLFILGDIFWRNGPIREHRRYASRLRQAIACRHIQVVRGNHDHYQTLLDVFGYAPESLFLKNFGDMREPVFMSHFPHIYWEASHWNSYHLYGHMHGQREDTLDAAFPDRRSLDVGVDNAAKLLGAYRPFSEHEVLAVLKDRPGHDPITFYRS